MSNNDNNYRSNTHRGQWQNNRTRRSRGSRNWNNKGGGFGRDSNARSNNDFIQEYGCEPSNHTVTIAIEGCCHGELDAIYNRLRQHEEQSGRKIDLLLCCGDFQSLRNTADFHSLAVPEKYRALGSFYRYYANELQAPILTVFIGGNHEASQALQELPYGGWVAPNIYYMGLAGVINFNGIRIGGISGIYKSNDFTKGHYEHAPFDRSSLRSVYHLRNVDVYRLKCLYADTQQQQQQQPLDIMISHDWPQGIEQYGDTAALIRTKPFFRAEIERNNLGSRPNRELLDYLRPKWWFSAHLHVKFHAQVNHGTMNDQKKPGQPATKNNTLLVPSQAISTNANGPAVTQFVSNESKDPCLGPDLTEQMTQFLALDKCLPRRSYLSILHVPVDERREDSRLEFDTEWLAILRKTHDLTKNTRGNVRIPNASAHVTSEDRVEMQQRLGSLVIPENFCATVPPHVGAYHQHSRLPPPLLRMGNPQQDWLLDILGVKHISTVPYDQCSTGNCMPLAYSAGSKVPDENEIDIDDHDDDSEIGIQDNIYQNGESKIDTVARDENEIDLDTVEEEESNDGAMKKARVD
jgi:lariat debranching enzyme